MGGSVSGVKKNHKKSENRGPETPASLPENNKTWPPNQHKLDMAANVTVKFIKKRPKKGKRLKGYITERFMSGNAVIMLIF